MSPHKTYSCEILPQRSARCRGNPTFAFSVPDLHAARSELRRSAQVPADPQGEGRQRVGDQGSEPGPGGLLRRCSGQVSVLEDVRLARGEGERHARHQSEESLLHRCAGYRRLRDLRGECISTESVVQVLSLGPTTRNLGSDQRFGFACSSTPWSSCSSTTRTSVCSSSSTTTCSCWSRRSTRRRASTGSSSTSEWTCRPPSSLSRRSANV